MTTTNPPAARRIHSTPWGAPQHQTAKAPGITFVSTASHGGFFLDAEAMRRMPSQLLIVPTFAGPGWYEEDCDWAIVALAFPALFDAVTLDGAVRTVRGHASLMRGEPDSYAPAVHWLDESAEGKRICQQVAEWRWANADKYQMGGGSSGFSRPGVKEDRWLSFLYRVGDNAPAGISWENYPTCGDEPRTLAEFVLLGATIEKRGAA